MALNYKPEDYQAIHSTFEDNYVYRNDANYIASLNSIVDPVLRMAWIPGSWAILAGTFFQNSDPGRHVKRFSDVIFEDWQPRWLSIDWGFEHATVVLWCTRVRVKTEFDPAADRTTLLCYRQLVMRQMNEQLVAEKIAAANYTGDKFDPIQHIYLSPDHFSKDRSASLDRGQDGRHLRSVRSTAPGVRKQPSRRWLQRDEKNIEDA